MQQILGAFAIVAGEMKRRLHQLVIAGKEGFLMSGR
jgi:hypothetical protein